MQVDLPSSVSLSEPLLEMESYKSNTLYYMYVQNLSIYQYYYHQIFITLPTIWLAMIGGWGGK